MEVSSYGGAATESSGLVRILKDLSASIAGEDVLIVEDIIDTGLTLNYLIRYLRGKSAGVAPDLHAARQARPAARRDPGRLHRLHHPRPVRRRLRPRLRRAVPEPALRRRAPAGGLHRGPWRMTMHRRPAGPRPDAGRDRRAAPRRRLRPAVVEGRRARPGSRPSPATASRAAGSWSSWSASPRWRWSRCRTRPATGRSASTAGCRTPSWRSSGWIGFGMAGRSSWPSTARSSSPSRPRSSRTARACGSRRWASSILSRAAYDMSREPVYR